MTRQFRRRDSEFLDVIEAAAMDLPCGAVNALALSLLGVERVVERHEIERGADPADAHDHVSPADQQVGPFAEKNFHHKNFPFPGAFKNYGIRIDEPVVARLSSSRCARCASLSGYF